MTTTPRRIAVLFPELRPADHASALLLWGGLIETMLRHPQLAVADLGTVSLQLVDGRLSPYASDHGDETARRHFETGRCDELVWLEAPLDAAGAVRLHCRARGGAKRSFAALGPQLGAQVNAVLDQWLHACELEPLARPFADLSREELAAAALAFAGVWAELRQETAKANDDAPLATNDAPALRTPALAERLHPTLKVPALRLIGVAADEDVAPLVAAVEPEHPAVLLAAFTATAAHKKDWPLLRRAIAAAPNWPATWLELEADRDDKEAPTPLEALAAAGWATLCDPAERAPGEQLARALADADRDDEAVRACARVVASHEDDPRAHLQLLECWQGADRLGGWLGAANHASWLHGCPMDSFFPWTPTQIQIDLACSTALMHVGRIDEAIALRKNRLELAEGSWPRQQQTLDAWRKDPRWVAWSYAREGFARGEDARAVEGLGRIEPGDGIDVGQLLTALIATGRERDVPLAWAQFGRGRRLGSPYAQLAAARALLAAGQWRRGVEELFELWLQHPTRDDDAAVAHAARLLACAPTEELAEAVAQRLDAGAHTMAWHLARLIADFAPVDDETIAAALGDGDALAFDGAWLAGFAADTRSRPAIDALFAECCDPGDDEDEDVLARADHLVNRWGQVVFVGASPEDAPGLAQATAYLLAQALTRHLALTTAPPTPLSGACRTVAAEALLRLRPIARELRDGDLAALLGALEPLCGHVDARLYERWLAAVERALGLDERWGGRLHGPAKVVAHLYGPEQLARLSRGLAERVRARPSGWAREAAEQGERLTWLTGTTGIDEWSLAVENAELAPEAAADAQLTACAFSRGRVRAPAIRAAHALFAVDHAAAAVRTLVDGLGAEPDSYQDPAVPTLEAPWKQAGVKIPFAFKKAATRAFELLQAGKPAPAVDVLRWAVALDDHNAEAHRNLGLALAQTGDVAGALEHLCYATRDQGTQLCAGILFQAGHAPLSLAVLDYASRWYVRADQWITYGAICAILADTPRTLKAYGLAWQLDPTAFDASQLNSYAGFLDDVGEHDHAEKVARRLVEVAGEDPAFVGCGAFQLACALVGQERFDEALPLAEKAVEKNAYPDNAAVYAMILDRARTKTRGEPMALEPTETPREPWFELLDQGDVAAAAELIGDDDWRARRAALRACRFRFASENAVEVTPRARDAAGRVLEDSRGADELDAVVCRALALETRMEAELARDPAPKLGDRMTREAFYAEFRARGGVILGEAPPPPPPFVDREVLPGGKVATASAYVALLRDLARLAPRDALARHGLDEAVYLDVAKAWGAALDADASLHQTIAAGLAG